MAQIQDRKGNFYSHKQSVRDESCAPVYLESAGDVLIKDLARKQVNTSTTLKEQLEIVQNFEKGFELNSDKHKGLASLKDFKKHIADDESSKVSKSKESGDLEDFIRPTGLSRHELELSLCEKPNSDIAQLYRFAVGSRKHIETSKTLESKLPNHPINHLKEIEEECFSHLKRKKKDLMPASHDKDKETTKAAKKKKKQHRKRRKKVQEKQESKNEEPAAVENLSSKFPSDQMVANSGEIASGEDSKEGKPSTSRPSLWDVKDMEKWSKSKEYGCKPQTFYTIKNGKIVKLEKDNASGDIT